MKARAGFGQLLAAIVAVVGCGVALALAGEGDSAPARAAVAVTDCPAAGVHADEVFPALSLELAHDGVAHVVRLRSGDEGTAALDITLDCRHQGTRVLIRVQAPARDETRREMDLADLPRPLRARAVALAAAELSRAAWSSEPSRDARDGGAAVADAGSAAPATPEVAPVPAAFTPADEARPVVPSVGSASPSGPSARFAVAAGLATKWLAGADSPAFGGRLSGRGGRWRAGADLLFAHDAVAVGKTTLALAVGWAALDLLTAERGRWRFSTGPRLAAGVGWSPATIPSAELVQGGPFPDMPLFYPPVDGSPGGYVEGGALVEASLRARGGWSLVLDLDAGLGWGAAPSPARWLPRLRPGLGAAVQLERAF